MAILQRVALNPSQRWDTPDARSIEAFSLNDWRFFLSGFYSQTSYVLSGFEISNYLTIFSTSGFNVKLSNVALFHSQATTQAAGFYVSSGTEQDLSLTLAASTTNFIEASLTTISAVPDVRAFWDQGANGGQGGEFTDTIDTVINLELVVTSNVSGFSTNAMPLYKVVTNSSGIVTSVTDCRNLFFRLGTGGTSPNPLNSFAWPSLPDASHARLETPNTATSATITNNPTQGGDKNITNFKAWMDAVMSSFKEIKGTPYWYQVSSGSSGSVPFAFQNAALVTVYGGKWEHLPSPTPVGHLTLSIASAIARFGFSNQLTLNTFTDFDLSTDNTLYVIAPSTDSAVAYGFGEDGASAISPKDVLSVTSSSITVTTGGNYIVAGGNILVGGVTFAYTGYTAGTGLFSGVTPDPSGAIVAGDIVYQLDDSSTGYYHQSSKDLVPSVISGVSSGVERTIWLAYFNGTNLTFFPKLSLNQGQITRFDELGNSGTGITKVTFHDPISTTLPTGPTVIIDGVAGVNGDSVLFTNLLSGNNEIYELSGVGVSIVWTAKNAFSGLFAPTSGDVVIVTSGIGFTKAIGAFNGTAWSFNDAVRYYKGADYWEQSGLITTTLTDNSSGVIYSTTALGSENFIVDFSILRNGLKEVGQAYITHDGVNAFVSSGGVESALTGVTFSADISGADVRLLYTLTSTGFNATFKYSVKRWSDATGGPSGLPSYTPSDSTISSAAFVMSDNSGTPVGCNPVYNVLGKTRVDLSAAYVMGRNGTTTVGDLDVYVNGQRMPRFISGTTLDGFYKEISTITIEFYTDLTSSPVSIEIIKRA